MPRYVALLRAVNVGKRKAPMAALRAMAEELGLEAPKTLLQSGNLVFGSSKSESALETLLEKEAEKRFGFAIDFMLRSRDHWQAIIDANPYPKQAKDDAAHLVVLALKKAPATGALEALRAAIKGPETVEINGREAYIHYPDDIGHSKLTNTVLEKKLGVPGTGRNWNTVLKLMQMLEA